MMKYFKTTEQPGVECMQEVVKEMEEVLDSLCYMKIPCEDYTIDDLSKLCFSLVEGQRNDIEWLKPGSWCVAMPGCAKMPLDARVDFVMFPTYIAISILTFCINNFPTIKVSLEGKTDALKLGYTFATGMKLNGHGYDAEHERKRAIEILRKGGVIDHIALNPDFSPEMFQLVRELHLH
jgi:hypothetical protein